ncbi:MAG: hypothetical protein K1X81_01985 [Bacteroidia bacterium]|nr:hypothetical protein [Bacteroidia bacterium]
MNDKDFRKLVAEMRQAQKDYFSTRSSSHLTRAKQLERKVDAEVKIEVKPDNQQSMNLK